jgi:acetyl-CoA C-acetyltransferase
MKSVAVATVLRTPIGRAGKGSLRDIRPDDLVAGVIRATVDASGIDPALLDDHVLGCGYPEGKQGYNVARRAGLLAGLPESLPGSTVTRFCASSLQATRTAAHAIMTGESRACLVSGVESISQVGRTLRDEHRHPDLTASGPLPDVYVPMVDTAENVATAYHVSRADMDAYSVESHRRAVQAAAQGAFAAEVVPVDTPSGTVTVSGERGRVTAGNACPLNDGAVAGVLIDEDVARADGVDVRARILASSLSALSPAMMGVGPIQAVSRLLDRTGLTIRDIDVIELNEAFASQVLAVCRALDIDQDKQLNPLGGAIALGHPFGMTGLRLVGAVVRGLERTDGHLGIATLCIGGGQGMAMLIERI